MTFATSTLERSDCQHCRGTGTQYGEHNERSTRFACPDCDGQGFRVRLDDGRLVSVSDADEIQAKIDRAEEAEELSK